MHTNKRATCHFAWLILGVLGAISPACALGSNTWQELLVRADSLSGARLYDSAIAVAQEALAQAEITAEYEDSVATEIRYTIGVYYFYQGQYDKTETFWNTALAGRRRVYGDTHAEVGALLRNMGTLYQRQGRYDDAQASGREALSLFESLYGPDDPSVAKALNALAGVHYYRREAAEAEALYRRALDIWERVPEPDSAHFPATLHNLAGILEDQARFDEAEALYTKAYELWSAAYGLEHPFVAQCLNNIAVMLEDQGRFHEAEAVNRQTLALRADLLGPEHDGYAQSLKNLASVLWKLGRYSEAEKLFEQALTIDRAVFGNVHRSLAISLTDLANLYSMRLSFGAAKSSALEALAICREVYGPDHAETADTYEVLGNISFDQGSYQEAHEAYSTALRLLQSIHGPTHPELAHLMTALARTEIRMGRMDAARGRLETAADLQRQAFGAGSVPLGRTLTHLGELYLRLDQVQQADTVLSTALAMLESTVGTDHPYAADVLELQARRNATSRPQSSLDLLYRVYTIRKSVFDVSAAVLPEHQALAYSEWVRGTAAEYLATLLTLESIHDRVAQQAAEIVFSSKGAVSDEIFNRARQVRTSADPNVQSILNHLGFARYRRARLLLGGPDLDTAGSYRHVLDSLSHLVDSLEQSTAEVLHANGLESQAPLFSMPELNHRMSGRGALIDFMHFDHRTWRGGTVARGYLAVVITGHGSPRIVSLSDADSVVRLVDGLRSLISAPAQGPPQMQATHAARFKQVSNALFQAVWAPLEAHLDGVSAITVAPDGVLNTIPFGVLTDPSGAFLIERYAIDYVSAAREVLRTPYGGSSGQQLLALGDPDFDYRPKGASPQDRLLPWAAFCASENAPLAVALPGTRREVQRVSQSWLEITGQSADVFLDTGATESNLKSRASHHAVLHLATHGYYLNPDCEGLNGGLNRRDRMAQLGANPLLFSGLLLAGANAQVANETDDGILTAEEVAALDLSGTRLVVLSACESGLGAVRDGEGVYGLRRAFRLAGAGTVLSALWSVSDDVTAECMDVVYRSLREQRVGAVLRDYALQQIQTARDADRFPDPYYWAPFVAVGDWGD